MNLDDMDLDESIVIKSEPQSDSVDDPDDSQPVPEIGSKNSAFQPYRPLTILTNLQRGNVKTYNKDVSSQLLTFYEKAARGDITEDDIIEVTVNEADEKGLSALMWASFHGKLSTVHTLIAKGAEIDFRGNNGETSLMFAAANGHHEVLSYLLTKGAQVEAVDDNGNTPLIFAAHGNHPQCVQELLSKGAKLTTANGMGETPYEISVAKGLTASQFAIENYLKDYIESNLLQK